jgi:putative transposase
MKLAMRITNPQTGETYFSKRRRRYDDEHCPRELTFCCYHGFPFLAKDRSRQWFIDALETARRNWPIDVHAWVIMPEHVHLLIAPHRPGVKVGRFAGHVKEQVARKAITWLEDNAPHWIPKMTVIEGSVTRRRFWQPGGGYDRNVDDADTFLAMIDYLHLNPVRRGLVQRAVDWEWSSARWYAGYSDARLTMDPISALWLA